MPFKNSSSAEIKQILRQKKDRKRKETLDQEHSEHEDIQNTLETQRPPATFNQCCGSGVFMPDSVSEFFHPESRISIKKIPDPGSRIPDPGTRIRIRIKEFKFFLNQKIVSKLSQFLIRDIHPGSATLPLTSVVEP